MNIQERIEALETEFNEKIKVLKAEVQREDEFPQDGDEYWYVDDIGLLWLSVFGKGELSNDRVEMGNVFRTKEEAGFVAEKIKVEAELRKFGRPFEEDKNNYFMVLDTDYESIDIWSMSYSRVQGVIYFESEEKAQQAIEAVGEERIKKYIFGVEVEQ